MAIENQNDREQIEENSKDAGFSLVELMVVVFIMGLLSTLIIVNVAPVGESSRITKAEADIVRIENSIYEYNLDLFSYPDANDGLEALRTAPAGVDASRYRQGGYIRRLRDDPWGNPYQYRRPAERSGSEFDVFSSGPDGEPGTDDDIGNWDNA